MQDCIFCKIVNKEVPANIVFENERILAFRDISPSAPEHILIIPKKHVTSLLEFTQEDEKLIGEINICAAHIAKQLGLDKKGFRTVANTGAHGGQTVFHYHLHLLGGRQMTWPAG